MPLPSQVWLRQRETATVAPSKQGLLCTLTPDCRPECELRLRRQDTNMHMLQASEDSGLRGSLEVDCKSVQVSSPSQGVILAVLTGAGLVESEQGMCSM